MTKLLISIALVTLLLPIATLATTKPPTDRPEPTQTPERRKTNEFLPARTAMDRFLRRWTHEVAAQYDLDAKQRDKATGEVIRRWGLFFDQNRRTIEPLFLEYLQMHLGLEPPDKSRVRNWARRAAPLLADLRNHVAHGVTAIRDILDAHQRARFEKQVQAFHQGLDDAEAQLGRVEKGEFNSRDFSELFGLPGPHIREGRGLHTISIRRAEPEVSRDRIEIEIDLWRTYVASFIRTHGLDPGQRNAAISVLLEMCGRAGDLRARRRKEIEGLEGRIDSFDGSAESLAELKKQLSRLYGPFDAMFSELDGRLYELLTAQQRARIATDKPASEIGNRSGDRPPDP